MGIKSKLPFIDTYDLNYNTIMSFPVTLLRLTYRFIYKLYGLFLLLYMKSLKVVNMNKSIMLIIMM